MHDGQANRETNRETLKKKRLRKIASGMPHRNGQITGRNIRRQTGTGERCDAPVVLGGGFGSSCYGCTSSDVRAAAVAQEDDGEWYCQACIDFLNPS